MQARMSGGAQQRRAMARPRRGRRVTADAATAIDVQTTVHEAMKSHCSALTTAQTRRLIMSVGILLAAGAGGPRPAVLGTKI